MFVFHQTRTIFLIIISMLALGIALTVISAIFVSSFLAILGVTIVFFGVILLYVAPSKHIPLELMNNLTESYVNNTERILNEFNPACKGVYLPPKNLQNIESSLVFVPKTAEAKLPLKEDVNQKLLTEQKNGILITPSGFSLSQLYEKTIGTSFTKKDLKYVQSNLPRILIEDLELVETAAFQTQNDKVVLEITGSILDMICEQTRKQPLTHETLGCLFSSSIACVLAKASGQPVVIENEEKSKNDNTTRIEYQIIEG